MTNAESTEQRMTRAEIRAQYLRFQSLERTLLGRVIAMEKATGVEIPVVNDAEEKIRERVRAGLNGHASRIFKSGAPGASLSQVRIELDEVRKILRALTNADVEEAAVEALQRAEKLSPTERAWVRDLALTMARWRALTESVEAFYEAAGGDVTAALPLSNLAIRWCTIDTGSWASMQEVLAEVVAAGVVSAAELKRAGRVEGASQ